MYFWQKKEEEQHNTKQLDATVLRWLLTIIVASSVSPFITINITIIPPLLLNGNGWFSMFSNFYPKVKLNNALKGGKLLLEAATSSSQRKKSPGGQIRRIRQITRRLPCDWQICFRPTLADNMLRLVALFTYANGLINDRNSVHYKQSKSRHDVFLK